MRSTTIMVLRWKITGRIELFTNFGKLYAVYNKDMLGISRSSLYKKKKTFIVDGYQNDIIELYKFKLKKDKK
jgi:hypothetical protein